ncbi:MAG: class I SAM-dependent methyltransferase [Gammaproteobacteria bacterium]
MNTNYFLSTGEIDRKRLTITSKLYNPPALNFLKNCGLEPGMTVLEIGCGTGHMAVDLAKFLGSKGKVIAIDSSEDQIKVARDTAKEYGVENIEFHVCNVFDIDKLGISYDATFGRWVIEFTQQPEKALELMYEYLTPGGILAYEATNMEQTAFFSCPYHQIIEQWHNNGANIFRSHDYRLKFGYEVYDVFKQLHCKDIRLAFSQAILTTPEEKSVYRLGLTTIKAATLAKKFLTEKEIEDMIKRFIAFEESDAISGFYQNILISGKK